MPKTYKITIQDTPTSHQTFGKLSAGAVKRLRGRFNRAARRGVFESLLPLGFQGIPKKIQIDVVVYLRSTRNRIGVNMSQVIRALVDNGVIHDDSQRWFSWSQPVIKRDPNNPRVEITLTVLGDEAYCCGCGFTHKPGEDCPDGLEGKR